MWLGQNYELCQQKQQQQQQHTQSRKGGVWGRWKDPTRTQPAGHKDLKLRIMSLVYFQLTLQHLNLEDFLCSSLASEMVSSWITSNGYKQVT
jgi:hypothetical protein